MKSKTLKPKDRKKNTLNSQITNIRHAYVIGDNDGLVRLIDEICKDNKHDKVFYSLPGLVDHTKGDSYTLNTFVVNYFCNTRKYSLKESIIIVATWIRKYNPDNAMDFILNVTEYKDAMVIINENFI